jgi:glycosyltransferase involved in cell wall biosynthesis
VNDAPDQGFRVLLLVEAASGGTGRHVVDLAIGLVNLGYEVTVAYSPNRADAQLLTTLQLHPQISLLALPMARQISASDFLGVREIRRLLREEGPFDVAHSHSSKAGALLRLAAVGRNMPKCIHTPHAFVTLDPAIGYAKFALYWTVERLLARACSRIICVSEFERQHALKLGLDEDLLTVVPNGVDQVAGGDRNALRNQLGISEETVCIGTVGRLTHQKSLHRLLTAFSMVRCTGVDVHLAVVGDGPEEQSLRDQCIRLGMADNVSFIGHADGGRWMSAYDIFALSSLYEAFPYVLLEAAISGLPLVMMGTGGAGEVVLPDKNGFVSPQNDIEALASNLATLVGHPELRRNMGRHSIRIANRYSVKRMVRQIAAIYRSVAGGSQPTRDGESQVARIHATRASAGSEL